MREGGDFEREFFTMADVFPIRGAEKSPQKRRIQPIYFEYFEKYLMRVGPPRRLLAFDALDYEVCFCRAADLASHGARRIRFAPLCRDTGSNYSRLGAAACRQ
jgi:hypothetical protein